MAEECITLKPHTYGKLGVIHCGVAHEGLVSCAGDVANLEDGQEVRFARVRVVARRQGEEYTFCKEAS